MVAIGCLAAVLSLALVWEFVAPDDEAPPVEASVPAASAGPGTSKAAQPGFDGEALADIASTATARPLFSPTRRPSAAATTSASGTAVSQGEIPRLTGVIIGPSGGWAIFAGADGKSHAAAAGDAVGAFKVLAIGPGVVTLTGSEGDRVLRPTYVNQPAGASADVAPAPVAPLLVNRGARVREGAR